LASQKQVEFQHFPTSHGAGTGACQSETEDSSQRSSSSILRASLAKRVPRLGVAKLHSRFFGMLMDAVDNDQHEGKSEGEEKP
jgi:hypothetical protein